MSVQGLPDSFASIFVLYALNRKHSQTIGKRIVNITGIIATKKRTKGIPCIYSKNLLPSSLFSRL